MDNQQERLPLLGYLAGIIDGEGWVGLTKVPQRHGFGLRPIVAVHMVGVEWVDHLDDVAKQLGLPSYVAHLKESSRWGIYGHKRVARLLPQIRPYLFVKAAQADLLMELIEARLDRPYHSAEVSDREWQIFEEVKALNTKGKNPQRLYAQRREAMRQSDLTRDRESATEMIAPAA